MRVNRNAISEGLLVFSNRGQQSEIMLNDRFFPTWDF